MKPTPKLRFVERVIAVPATDGVGRTVRVLQQWWETDSNWPYAQSLDAAGRVIISGEWRDVPLEKEE